MSSDLLTEQFFLDVINGVKEETEDYVSGEELGNENAFDHGVVSDESNFCTQDGITDSDDAIRSLKLISSLNEGHDIFASKFDCPVCGQQFTDHRKYVRHLKSSHKDYKHDKKVKCPVCEAVFVDWGKFTRHLAIHTGKKSFECDICHRQFSRKDHMRKHRTVHVPDERKYSCPYCEKKFCENNILQRHLNSHTGHKPYKCGICGSTFFADSTLKQHLSTHSDDRPFLCTVCGKSFRRKGTLKHHMNVHKGKRPHECGVCHMKYTTRQTLVAHSRIHTGEMPFQCSKCSRQFMRRDVFKYHINRKTDCRSDRKNAKKEYFDEDEMERMLVNDMNDDKTKIDVNCLKIKDECDVETNQTTENTDNSHVKFELVPVHIRMKINKMKERKLKNQRKRKYSFENDITHRAMNKNKRKENKTV